MPPDLSCQAVSVFLCGSPYATTMGAEPMMHHDLTMARLEARTGWLQGDS